MWEVLYTDEFGAWFETLNEDQQDAVIARVELLEAEGPALGRPTVDTIASSRYPNMKELRVSKGGAIRILFAFDPAEAGRPVDRRRQDRTVARLVRGSDPGRRRPVRRVPARDQSSVKGGT